MRPFPYKQTLTDVRKEKYNVRLCRARRVVENAFGILSQKLRIFYRPLETKVDTTILIVRQRIIQLEITCTDQTETTQTNRPLMEDRSNFLRLDNTTTRRQ
ncbi:unnamed protein product [Acanthoscelides obtectus]|uniref:DDE Tnp4 domain-containing protein n=1 Tax=Acanthoscelides obtectus TaxID=200917 RepID=A0A9P0Q855_ACAOB|nr:unnamed protein product [Acanthoscelides obtectus]CAK1676415.1 hypothetical protein AOBTE_LOCUS30743 [Acanthoscelides obtectus]